MYLCPDAFTGSEKARNFAYHEALTVRDSSLSARIQSVLAAETGHLDLAHDYLGETALLDLEDLEHNTRSGLHLASLAGTWIALVPGLAGLRIRQGNVSFAPGLPEGITRLGINLAVRGRQLRVEITPQHTLYQLLDGDPIDVSHDGMAIHLGTGCVQVATSQQRASDVLRQPIGRTPAPRGTHRRAD